MFKIAESQIMYVPFERFDLTERSYQFRLSNADADEAIRGHMIKLGQLDPVAVEISEHGSLAILDGFRRCDAVACIRNTGGSWEKMLVQILPPGLPPVDRATLLSTRNWTGPTAYGAFEKARFLSFFFARGVSLHELASTTGASLDDVHTYLTLGSVPIALGELLNNAPIPLHFLKIFLEAYERWMTTPYQDHIEPTLRCLLDHAQKEALTEKQWRMLINFYWGGERPFMIPSRRP